MNPDSGPGSTPLPSADYVREIPKLNASANVVTLGYIRVHYCDKPLREVYAEVDAYTGWAGHLERAVLGMRGVFVDETPNHYSPERASYLDAVRQHIKVSPGIVGDKLMVCNFGTPPDAGLANPGPDVLITGEEPHDRYRDAEVQQRLKEYPHDRARSGFIIFAVPREQVAPFTRALRHRGAYLFVTDLVHDIYESFGSSWPAFVATMATT